MAVIQCDICGQRVRQFSAQEYAFEEKHINLCGKCWSQFDLYRYNAPSREATLAYFLLCAEGGRCTETGSDFIRYIQRKYDETYYDEGNPSPQAQERQARRKFIIVTGEQIAGYRITACHGMVTGVSAMGVGMLTGVTDWGSENTRLTNKLDEVKDQSLQYAVGNAIAAGGNALTSVKIAFDTLAAVSIAVIVSGTAVTVEKAGPDADTEEC